MRFVLQEHKALNHTEKVQVILYSFAYMSYGRGLLFFSGGAEGCGSDCTELMSALPKMGEPASDGQALTVCYPKNLEKSAQEHSVLLLLQVLYSCTCDQLFYKYQRVNL